MAVSKDRPADRLVVRVTRKHKALFERAARLQGCSLAVFIVSHLRRAAATVVREHDVIRLSHAESRRLIRALLNPPRPPTEHLKKALKRYRREIVSDLDQAPQAAIRKASAR